ncbi:MAG: hypothetical protein Q8O67_32570 [Deltaproteobacteria bacterium]|nr:hypothetical protein [Deltaproteobacteria bacterium]
MLLPVLGRAWRLRAAALWLVLLLLLLAPVKVSAQVLWPEDSPPLLADGSTTVVRLTSNSPVLAVATTTTAELGIRHVLAWGPASPSRTSLYLPTQLSFFFVPSAADIRLHVSGSEVIATGAGVQKFKWPEALGSWTLTDAGRPGGAETRLIALTEHRGSGCPATVITHWLQWHAGRLEELLTTEFTGEGGGDKLWFEGTIPVWPAPGGSKAEDDGLKSPPRFGAIADIPVEERVVVYDETITESQLCRGSRTIYRYRGGRLDLIRVEHLGDVIWPVICAQ